jgi:hypothetical protein
MKHGGSVRESPCQLAVTRSLFEGRLVALTPAETRGLFLLLVGGLLASIPRASNGMKRGGSVRESNPPETFPPPDRI